MKRLWRYITPPLSDVQGMEIVINETNGAGIIDDCSTYKPVGAYRGGNHGRKGGRGFHGDGERGHDFRAESHSGTAEMGRPKDNVRRRKSAVRTLDSEIRNEDIIIGTEKKVMDTYKTVMEFYDPDFILLSHAPSSSMIGSDLESNADTIREDSGRPVCEHPG